MLPRGYGKILKSRLVTKILAEIPPNNTASLRNGMRISVDINDYNGRMLFLFGSESPKVMKTCRTLLREGDIFFDIGANYGTIGLFCSEHVGSDGEVHLFEPQQVLCKRIVECLNDSKRENIYLHEYGLMDRDGILEMHVPVNHTGRGSFARKEMGTVTSLPVRDARKVLPELAGDKPVAAKVDVEGAEYLILPAICELPGLRYVVFECNDQKSRQSISKLFLGSDKWLVLGIPHVGNRYPVISDMANMSRHTDFVLIRRTPILNGETSFRLKKIKLAIA